MVPLYKCKGLLFATGVLLSAAGKLARGAEGVEQLFTFESRATNIDGSVPVYKNPQAPIEARVSDLLPRMTLEEKNFRKKVHRGSRIVSPDQLRAALLS